MQDDVLRNSFNIYRGVLHSYLHNSDPISHMGLAKKTCTLALSHGTLSHELGVAIIGHFYVHRCDRVCQYLIRVLFKDAKVLQEFKQIENHATRI